MTDLPVILGCDCDPDRRGFTPLVDDVALSWRGVEVGIPAFAEARRRFADKAGYFPKMTWFVRADYQVKRGHEDAGYCLAEFGDLWRSLEAEGDEIAWHPHLWAFDEQRGWYQKVGDTAFTADCLGDGYEAFARAWGSPPKTVHTGWCYQDNDVMGFMAEKGLLADCSAVPGHNTMGHGIADQADWSATTAGLYHPSRENYQVAGAGDGALALNILEVPASVGRGSVARALKVLRDQVKRRSLRIRFDGFKTQVPLMTLAPLINKGIISDALMRALKDDPAYFFSYTHADEFLEQSGKSLFARATYSLPAFFRNVAFLHDKSRRAGHPPRFVTLREFADRVAPGKSHE